MQETYARPNAGNTCLAKRWKYMDWPKPIFNQKGVAEGLGESYFKVPAILVDNGHSFFMTNKRK